MNERGIIGVVENHNQVIVGNEYKKNEDESWFNSINNNFVAYKKGFSNFIENRDNWTKI